MKRKRMYRRSIQWILMGLIAVFAPNLAAEELTIVGTGSGTVILKAIAADFEKQNTDITVAIPKSIGSGGGVKAVGKNEYLLGRVARPIKDKEKPYGLTYTPYARIPVVFYANKSAGVKTLTSQQILDIYSGKITDWQAVGGQPHNIRVITREEGDSSLEVLNNLFPGFNELQITSKAKMTFSDPETETAVTSTDYSVAYGSYPNVKLLDVNVLAIDAADPADDDYPYVGELGLIYKQENFKDNVKKFVEFATSDEAKAIIRGLGGLPMK